MIMKHSKIVKVPIISFTINQLLKYGVHLGNSTIKWNPQLSAYLYCFRLNICIFNLKHTILLFRRALLVLSAIIKQKGYVLFVASNVQNKHLIPLLTNFLKVWPHPYIKHGWLGGTITSWNKNYLAIKKYDLNKKSKKSLKLLFHGLSKMKYLPDAAILLNVQEDTYNLSSKNISLNDLGTTDFSSKNYFAKNVAIKNELMKVKIPTVGFINSAASLNGITYPIPVNTYYPSAIMLYLNILLYTFKDVISRQKLKKKKKLNLLLK